MTEQPPMPDTPGTTPDESPKVAQGAESSATHATNGDSREGGAAREGEAAREGGAAREGEGARTQSRSRRRGLLAAGGRATLALAVAAAGTALAVGVAVVPSPTFAPEPATFAVVPERTDQTLVCAGGALGLTRGDDPQLAVVAEPQRRSAGAGLVESSIAISDALDGGAAIVTLPKEAPADVLSAAESVNPRTSDVAGLAAAECLTPGRSAWLVGGSTTTGRTTWIVIANPGPVDATVDLDVYTEAGRIDAPGTSAITVAAGVQRIIALSGIVVGTESPVVRVTATGGSIVATLQHSIVRGLDASGIGIVTPLERPATHHVIPALPVIAGEAVLERSTDDGGIDALTAVRMLAAVDVPVEVRIRLIPASGEPGIALTTTLEPQTVVDLPFTELPDGDYAVVVDASEPIVVAARTSSATTAGLDLEWFTPTPALQPESPLLAAVAPGVGGAAARLHLLAPDAAATVTVDGRTVAVPAGTSVVLESASNIAVQLSTTATVHASVSYRGEAGLAGTRILPPPPAARAVTVLPY